MNAPVFPIAWSFSSLKQFKNCAKQYYHTREVKDYVGESGEAALYGKSVHEAIEAYMRDGVELPPEFSYLLPQIEPYMTMPGKRYNELDLALRGDYTPTTIDDPEVWLKGFADLVIVADDETRALVVDFKTGSPKWADPSQLELYALALFCRYPKMTIVNGALDFLAQDVLVKRTYKRETAGERWLKWLSDLDRIRRAREHNVWPAQRSGLCKFCPVTSCGEHPTWKTVKRF